MNDTRSTGLASGPNRSMATIKSSLEASGMDFTEAVKVGTDANNKDLTLKGDLLGSGAITGIVGSFQSGNIVLDGDGVTTPSVQTVLVTVSKDQVNNSTVDKELVTKEYLLALTADAVRTSGNSTIGGVYTFNALPVSSANPTGLTQLTPKAYVDTVVATRAALTGSTSVVVTKDQTSSSPIDKELVTKEYVTSVTPSSGSFLILTSDRHSGGFVSLESLKFDVNGINITDILVGTTGQFVRGRGPSQVGNYIGLHCKSGVYKVTLTYNSAGDAGLKQSMGFDLDGNGVIHFNNVDAEGVTIEEQSNSGQHERSHVIPYVVPRNSMFYYLAQHNAFAVEDDLNSAFTLLIERLGAATTSGSDNSFAAYSGAATSTTSTVSIGTLID